MPTQNRKQRRALKSVEKKTGKKVTPIVDQEPNKATHQGHKREKGSHRGDVWQG